MHALVVRSPALGATLYARLRVGRARQAANEEKEELSRRSRNSSRDIAAGEGGGVDGEDGRQKHFQRQVTLQAAGCAAAAAGFEGDLVGDELEHKVAQLERLTVRAA